MTEYRTVKTPACAEFTEKRSRFLCHARPVHTEEEAAAFLLEMRTRYWDASHNVYAYALRQGQIQRYSDDGEPQGTAGVPVLEVLLKSGVTDCALVVTRYFGGVLLGAGGLVRAYSHAAALGLEQAGVARMLLCKTARIRCDYSQYGRVAALVPEHGGAVEDAAFLEEVTLRFHMEQENIPGLQASLADATAGRCQIELAGEAYFEVSQE